MIRSEYKVNLVLSGHIAPAGFPYFIYERTRTNLNKLKLFFINVCQCHNVFIDELILLASVAKHAL